MEVSLSDVTMKEVELQYSDVSNGGQWSPTVCKSQHHVAIIIPYRDRKSHLKILLRHLHGFLQKQQLSYRIFVVEQVEKHIVY